MNLKKIAASAASALLLLAAPLAFSEQKIVLKPALTAYADYDFEFVDEDVDIDDIDIDSDYDIEYDDDDVYYNSSHDSRSSDRAYNPVKSFIICLIIGLVVAFIAVSIMKSSMKSVRKQTGAADYRKENGIRLRVNDDTYLGVKTEKSPIARANPVPPQNHNVRK
ncbi:hypothetical protein [Ruminococcus flavefaciens]|jgi:hypothetical protein|uniref:hypothetical protein n=1 Tax=Ruminococcus flavefaciens TaxID=1265 RepID=UPI00048B528C|nr:hypothetical protein [Ruminococcus flavefaciens]